MKAPEQITKVGLQIRRNWNKLFLFFCCLCALQTVFPQKPLRNYDSNSQFVSLTNDGFFETILYPGLILRSKANPDGNGEYFIVSDTMYRCYLHTDIDIMVDSLLLNDPSEYAMNFQPVSVYSIYEKKSTFVILECYNGYQIGTDVQPIYIVFKKGGSSLILYSVYQITDLEDNSLKTEQSVKVFIRNNRLFLKGKNLIRIRDYSDTSK